LTLTVGLIVARFVHFLTLSVLLGAALFPFYGLAKSGDDAYRRLSWLRPLLIGMAVLTLASGLLWFALMSDGAFVWIWVVRLVLAAAVTLLTLGKRAAGWRLKAIILTAVALLATIALTGNSGSNNGPLWLQHRLSDAVHLVASGVWIGALVVFSRLVTMSVRADRQEDLKMVHDALARFAGVGTLAVATLTLSGMTNPGLFLSNLGSAYGQLLLAKLGVFGAMLALAGANRFLLTPRLSAMLDERVHLRTAVNALRVSVLVETALGFIVLAMVAWLGVLPAPTFEPQTIDRR
jgi:putative copper resistance protein D